MPITNDRIAKLREFDFSEYAARVYLALLDLGVAEAREASTLSKVPTSKIYQILDHLHEKGLVEILPETPKKYAPVAFEDYLARLHDAHVEAAKAIDRDREELASLFAVVGNVDVAESGGFSLLRGRRNILDRIDEMIRKTRREWLAVHTPGLVHATSLLAPALAEARRRGVRARVLTPVDAPTLDPLSRLQGMAEVRAAPPASEGDARNVAIFLADDERALIVTFNPDDGRATVGRDLGIFTDQASMVKAITSLVHVQWDHATPLETRRAEIEGRRCPEFSRFYKTQGKAHAALHAAATRGPVVLRYIDTAAARPLAPAGRALLSALSPACKHRFLLSLRDIPTAEEHARIQAELPHIEFRHVDAHSYSRFFLVDGAEAFFAPTEPPALAAWRPEVEPEDAPDLLLHTNDPDTVESLGAQFEALWAQATPLRTRIRELTVFPHVQPRDVGIGRLFDLVRDAIVVATLDGRIVLWNPAATAMLGHAPEEALQLNVEAIIPERYREAHNAGLARFRASGVGAMLEQGRVLALPALRKDGTEVAVELSLSHIPVQGSEGFVLAILREAGVSATPVTPRLVAREEHGNGAAGVKPPV